MSTVMSEMLSVSYLTVSKAFHFIITNTMSSRHIVVNILGWGPMKYETWWSILESLNLFSQMLYAFEAFFTVLTGELLQRFYTLSESMFGISHFCDM